MDKAKLEELKELAKKDDVFYCTGEWKYRKTVVDKNGLADQLCYFEDDSDGGFYVPIEDLTLVDGNLAEYIAAANPKTVLDLIAEIERLEKARNDTLSKYVNLQDKARYKDQALDSLRMKYKELRENLTILYDDVKYRQKEVEQLRDRVKQLEKEADWLASRMKCDNTFTPEREAACIRENGPCVKCLREAARRNINNEKEQTNDK